MRQLSDEVASLKADKEKERMQWERKIAQSETEIATLKVNV